jgi:hypothetical protein
MRGEAYVFCRSSGAMKRGHVGWGFLLHHNDLYCFGATENAEGALLLLPGMNNHAWFKTGTYSAMLCSMKEGVHGAPGYNDYKRTCFDPCFPDYALIKARNNMLAGYSVIGFPGNNCADHTYGVLTEYGLKGLPLLQFHPSPNAWFDSLEWDYFILK